MRSENQFRLNNRDMLVVIDRPFKSLFINKKDLIQLDEIFLCERVTKRSKSEVKKTKSMMRYLFDKLELVSQHDLIVSTLNHWRKTL